MRTQGLWLLFGLEALTKEYTSPIVCVVLKREERRVPSPRRIWRDMVGCESSISTAACGAELDVPLAAFVDGTSGWDLAELPVPGVGLPSRCPPPENGLYFFFGGT